MAAFGEADVERLLADAGIVRNRAKIEAAIANARAALDLPDGLADAAVVVRARAAPARAGHASPTCRPSRRSRRRMAKDLKKRGFRFVGPTTAYALMQATGMVDDHLASCFVQLDRP